MGRSAVALPFLERCKRFRTQPPTFWRVAALSSPFAFFLIFFSAMVWYFWHARGQGFLGWSIGAFTLGVLFREFQMIRQFIRVWPTMSEVVDWDKLDALLSTETDRGASNPEPTSSE